MIYYRGYQKGNTQGSGYYVFRVYKSKDQTFDTFEVSLEGLTGLEPDLIICIPVEFAAQFSSTAVLSPTGEVDPAIDIEALLHWAAESSLIVKGELDAPTEGKVNLIADPDLIPTIEVDQILRVIATLLGQATLSINMQCDFRDEIVVTLGWQGNISFELEASNTVLELDSNLNGTFTFTPVAEANANLNNVLIALSSTASLQVLAELLSELDHILAQLSNLANLNINGEVDDSVIGKAYLTAINGFDIISETDSSIEALSDITGTTTFDISILCEILDMIVVQLSFQGNLATNANIASTIYELKALLEGATNFNAASEINSNLNEVLITLSSSTSLQVVAEIVSNLSNAIATLSSNATLEVNMLSMIPRIWSRTESFEDYITLLNLFYEESET